MKPRKNVNTVAMAIISRAIAANLPKGHGYALLVFPTGEQASGPVRYMGRGNHGDVMDLMQAWLNVQRPPAQATAPAPAGLQWSTKAPTEPGLYLVKSTDIEPDFVRLVPADGLLQIQIQKGPKSAFCATHDFVNELDPVHHIWCGPFPEPWANEAIAQALLSGDWEEAGEAIAHHHAERIEAILADYYAEFQSKLKNDDGSPLPDMIKSMLQDALLHGFAQGVAAQWKNPFTPQAS